MKAKQVYIVCVLFFVIGSYWADAQRYTSTYYTEADGLLSSKVYDVVQDTNGVMWYATRSGISSYDGLKFSNYSQIDGLSSQSFSFLDLDEKGCLWALQSVGTKSVYFFDGKKWVNFTESAGTKSDFETYTCLKVYYEANEAVIAIGTAESGLFIFRDGKWKNFKFSRINIENYISDCAFYNNKLYVVHAKGIVIIKGGELVNGDNLLQNLPEIKIKSLCISGDIKGKKNQLWILGEYWIGKLEQDSFSLVYKASQNFSFGYIGGNFISKTGRDEVYFGNPVSLYQLIIPQKKLTLLDRRSGFITDGATQAIEDREHNLWVTSYRGITKIGTRHFRSYYYENGLFENEVTAIAQAGSGEYAFGHYGAITRYRNGKFQVVLLSASEQERKERSRVLDLVADKNGNYWAAVSFKGLAKIDRQNKITWISLPSFNKNYVSSVICTRDGRIIVSSNSTLYEVKNDIARELPLQGISELRKIFEGSDNTLYLATRRQGIYQYSNSGLSQFTSVSSIQAKDVYSYCESKNGIRYVGTTAGLYKIQGNHLHKVNEEGLSVNRPVFLILEDNQGRLWFGTDNGIYRWDGKRLENFSVRYGLSGQEINRSAGLIDNNRHLWFGTNNGVTEYNPALDNQGLSLTKPLVSVQYLKTGEDSLSLSAPLHLASSQNNLVFYFRAISLISEKENKYQYILEGLNDTWSDPIPYFDPIIRFYDLNPGKYRLGIKACNPNGVWSEPVWSPEIRIHQPFYLHWWFVSGAILLLILLIVLIVRFMMMTRYNLRLEKTVSDRTLMLQQSEEKLIESNRAKDKFFSIIAHDLKNPVTALNSMLELLNEKYDDFSEADKKRILGNLKSSSDLTIELLDNLLTWARAQKGLLPFDPVIFNLNDVILENIVLLKLHATTKQIRIQFQECENAEVFADRNMISAIVRNLISNAIKFTYLKGVINILVEKSTPGYVTCSISDNGRGMTEEIVNQLFKIDEMRVMKGTEGERGTGLGLILCQDFIRKNGGEISVTSKEKQGSTFMLSLPAGISS